MVCHSGGRSNSAANFLDSQGFTNIYDMKGGMSSWTGGAVGCVDSDNDGLNDDLDLKKIELRNSIGEFLIFINWLFPPSKIPKRSSTAQEKVNQSLESITLFEFRRCPFCIKVRRHLKRLRLQPSIKNALDPVIENELIAGGGKRKVPCLKIQNASSTTWLYDSSKINDYLSTHFTTTD